MIQLAKITFWERKRHDWSCGKAPQRRIRDLGQSVEVFGESLSGLTFGYKRLVEKPRQLQWPAAVRAPRFCKGCGKGRFGKASGFAWTRGKYGPHGELFLFLFKQELVVASKGVLPNPFVSAETLRARWLIGLHLLAAEGEAGSSGSQSPDLGDMWRYGCPKSPQWISSCSTSDTSFGGGVYEQKQRVSGH